MFHDKRVFLIWVPVRRDALIARFSGAATAMECADKQFDGMLMFID